jgi:soluble lytic murein transglycosylase-like protein
MEVTTIILNAAKVAKVSGTLLLAICSHESNNFTMNYAPHDHGTPSYGQCQLKFSTSKMLGFKGKAEELNDPTTNALWAAKYLAYQQTRYGRDDWVMLTGAYNAGSYLPSKKMFGCPRNVKYVRLVQRKLPLEYQDRLNCWLVERTGIVTNE